ncbi:GNAT family N-acetyltransferase [Tabrizicola sp.]|uniref:GNAT family N-acetyltransferase n=1 Tax=Tabrizicola sp. TaxID=2005166 RepID=UPI002FDE6890
MRTIQTERLVLRNFGPGDAQALFEYMHKPVAACFFDEALPNMEAAQADVAKRSGDDGQIAVCLKDGDMLIGDLFAHSEREDVPGWDSVSVGWNFNPAFAGRGYAYEAAQALFAHLFGQPRIRRLYAYVEDHNSSSERLCEKLGMRKEGVFVEYVTFGDDEAGQPIYENTMQYAILRREWEASLRG